MPASARSRRHHTPDVELTDRQAAVLRAVITVYVGEAAPIGSATLSHLLPVRLSSASIRTTLAELTDLGLLEKPYASAGRVPTELGLRLFVDCLLGPGRLGDYERRTIDYTFDVADADTIVNVASSLLSECTRQLGFVVAPRLDRVVLRHVTLVRLSSERILLVLVSSTGATHRRVIESELGLDQVALDRVAVALGELVDGHTLSELRELVARDAEALRLKADRLLRRAVQTLAFELSRIEEADLADLVIESRLALLDQPEFRDPARIRELFEAIETKERLLEVLDRTLAGEGVCVAIGDEVDHPALRQCAVVGTHYGTGPGAAPLGMLGVIGPSRMDYARVIPFVHYMSQAVTEKLSA